MAHTVRPHDRRITGPMRYLSAICAHLSLLLSITHCNTHCTVLTCLAWGAGAITTPQHQRRLGRCGTRITGEIGRTPWGSNPPPLNHRPNVVVQPLRYVSTLETAQKLTCKVTWTRITGEIGSRRGAQTHRLWITDPMWSSNLSAMYPHRKLRRKRERRVVNHA